MAEQWSQMAHVLDAALREPDAGGAWVARVGLVHERVHALAQRRFDSSLYHLIYTAGHSTAELQQPPRTAVHADGRRVRPHRGWSALEVDEPGARRADDERGDEAPAGRTRRARRVDDAGSARADPRASRGGCGFAASRRRERCVVARCRAAAPRRRPQGQAARGLDAVRAAGPPAAACGHLHGQDELPRRAHADVAGAGRARGLPRRQRPARRDRWRCC